MREQFKNLDPILHSRLRLAIVSLLVSVEDADFTYLREMTESTSGNLSVQLDKLEKAGYISIRKSFRGKRPLTTCKLTSRGLVAFEKYVDHMKGYLNIT